MDKKVELFFEGIEIDYQEAVIGKQISPTARAEVEKSKEGHKKEDMKLLSQRELGSKDFHALSPMKKNRIAKSMGFGGKKNEVGNILTGSPVHPDVLFALSDTEFNNRDAGQTFVYSIERDDIISGRASKGHYDIQRKSKGFKSEREDEGFIHGRWINMNTDVSIEGESKQDFYFLLEPYDFKKGNHLSFWRHPDDELLKKIINKLSEHNFQHIHLPNQEAIDVMS